MQKTREDQPASSSRHPGFATEHQDGPRPDGWIARTTDAASPPVSNAPAAFTGPENGAQTSTQPQAGQPTTELPPGVSELTATTQLIMRPTGEKDWEDRRDLITELYSEQDRELNDVIAIMRRHHRFLATSAPSSLPRA